MAPLRPFRLNPEGSYRPISGLEKAMREHFASGMCGVHVLAAPPNAGIGKTTAAKVVAQNLLDGLLPNMHWRMVLCTAECWRALVRRCRQPAEPPCPPLNGPRQADTTCQVRQPAVTRSQAVDPFAMPLATRGVSIVTEVWIRLA